MAYDRYEREQRWREGRSEDWNERDPRSWDRDHERDRDDRGFLGRVGDEFRSWFGEDEDGRSRHGSREDAYGRYGGETDGRWKWASSERSYNPDWSDKGQPRSSRPDRDERTGQSPWDRDPYRRTSFAGSREPSNIDDRHYHEMRRRQADDLDRDYDEFRRERASKFESEFGEWRERRISKRQLLSGIREHMEVVGSDDKHVGTVDRIAGDRIVLTRSDSESGGAHHSLSCSDVDRIDGDRVLLECSADKAKERWRDENRSRALFEREDQGRAGPHVLDRSFSGTYR
ncbi:DUF2171 domain-containing protein [Sphingomonas daechungensis]|uniref:DUF2171 domain-containing protein n=1 Tax=Sphingomonas daechungensis TaxID=1176646 RepID=UPI0037842439